ncbi:MAG TPA: response regulator transcription factor [Bryobacteraceae bacterium]|nr:response regulator transcription factor [Bryobacteraceae bacterium]
MVRILLVDDHRALQIGLREVLSEEFPNLEVEYANNEEAALTALAKGHWNVAIVDINFPGRGGLELIRLLKQRRPLLKVLVYTMHAEQEFGIRALRSGADGYLTKDSPIENLFQAIRQLQAGRKYLSSDLADRLASAVAEDFDTSKHEKLSAREYEVFRGMIENKSLTEIAADLEINIKTVSTYRVRIFQKLQVDNHGELLRYAMRHGLIQQ